MKFLITLGSFLILLGSTIYVQASEPPLLQDLTIIPLQSTGVVQVNTSQKTNELVVDHKVSGGNVYVECFVNDFHFNENKVGSLHQENEGHIRLYINDEHIETLYQPAFIVQDLPKGNYEIKVMIVKNDRSPYEMEETFTVMISE
ncbi:hypothetical protein [Halalkalibacter alkalisediminis]|uniref:DUF4399 domain-containing protein n=1 Tax=Halalkalibacter alkalisediminis TaxID=935616 RepID=A0ABV6ND88_9BACI|nr:hypothetical protein [Halalkalibacter alkalisediminis]